MRDAWDAEPLDIQHKLAVESKRWPEATVAGQGALPGPRYDEWRATMRASTSAFLAADRDGLPKRASEPCSKAVTTASCK